MGRKKTTGLLLSIFAVALLAPISMDSDNRFMPSKASANSLDVQIDALCAESDCGESTIANSNTTRKLAVSSNGTIYVLFRNSNGIWVSKSTNRGVSFSSAVNVSAENREAEIGTSANGKVYVVWNSNNSYVISSSSDGAQTWQTPVVAGQSSGAQAHMAISGDYIYLVGQSGTTLYHSSNGGQTWGTTTVGTSQAFADVHVDPITKHVYVFTDNPTVFWYVSTDNGQTLSTSKATGKSVFFSVGALTSTGASKYFYMAGSGANLERINLSDESVLTSAVSSSAGSTTRSLAADTCGNVVSGHKSGTSLEFQYSTDSGQTFSTAQTVVASGDRANASINTTNGDVMFLYESAGNIFLSTYSGLFGAGTNCYAASISQTAIEFTAPGQTPSITLNNTSSSPLSVDSISITGSAFVVSHTCGTSIAPGGSCVVSINGTTQANETLSIVLGGTERTIPVSLGSVAALQPAVTPPSTTPPATAPEQTSSTSLPPQQTPENPSASSPPETSSPQPVLPEKKDNLNKEQKDSPTLPSTGAQNTWIISLALVFLFLGFVSIFTSKKEGCKNEA
jgi:LPXTG-motif cell wall-anchored protein